MSEDCKNGVRVQGTFLGQAIDLTIVEYDVPAPESDTVTPPLSETPEVPETPETPSADPAPAAAPVDDAPKNPAGNAEQV